jgi:hypothetical protein
MNKKTPPLPYPASCPKLTSLRNCPKMKKTITNEKIDAFTVDNPAIGLTSALTNPIAVSIIMSHVLAKIAN